MFVGMCVLLSTSCSKDDGEIDSNNGNTSEEFAQITYQLTVSDDFLRFTTPVVSYTDENGLTQSKTVQASEWKVSADGMKTWELAVNYKKFGVQAMMQVSYQQNQQTVNHVTGSSYQFYHGASCEVVAKKGNSEAKATSGGAGGTTVTVSEDMVQEFFVDLYGNFDRVTCTIDNNGKVQAVHQNYASSKSFTSSSSHGHGDSPSFTFGFSYRILEHALANGETFELTELELSEESIKEGCEIVSVTYSFDGKPFATRYAAPYDVAYPIQNQEVGEHQLTIKVHCKKGELEQEQESNVKIFVLERPLDVGIKVNFTDADVVKNGVKNGDVLAGDILFTQTPSPADAKIKKIKYYWDNHLISTAESEPFAFSYLIKGQSVGSHVFSAECTVGSSVTDDMVTQYNYVIKVKE